MAINKQFSRKLRVTLDVLKSANHQRCTSFPRNTSSRFQPSFHSVSENIRNQIYRLHTTFFSSGLSHVWTHSTVSKDCCSIKTNCQITKSNVDHRSKISNKIAFNLMMKPVHLCCLTDTLIFWTYRNALVHVWEKKRNSVPGKPHDLIQSSVL